MTSLSVQLHFARPGFFLPVKLRDDQVPSPRCQRVMVSNGSLSRRRRQNRNSLFWGLGGFALIQLTLAVAIESKLPQFRDPEFGCRLQLLHQLQVRSRPAPFLVLALGSSRTTAGIRGDILSEQLGGRLPGHPVAFNFGVTGAGPITHLINLRRLLKEGIRPGFVLIEILPPMLNARGPNAEAGRLTAQKLWLDDVDLLVSHYGRAPQLREEWLAGWPIPGYEHRYPLVSRLGPSLIPYPDRLDWVYTLDRFGSPREQKRERTAPDACLVRAALADYSIRLADFTIGGTGCSGIKGLLDLCSSHGIAAALLLMPEGREFRALYQPSVWRQIETHLEALSQAYQVPVINARAWLPDACFIDSHHLLPSGARQFSRRLAQESLVPLIQKLPWDYQPRNSVANH